MFSIRQELQISSRRTSHESMSMLSSVEYFCDRSIEGAEDDQGLAALF